MWRPENWEEIIREIKGDINNWDELDDGGMTAIPESFIGAGADAMLNCLLSCGIISISQLEAKNKNGNDQRNFE